MSNKVDLVVFHARIFTYYNVYYSIPHWRKRQFLRMKQLTFIATRL